MAGETEAQRGHIAQGCTAIQWQGQNLNPGVPPQPPCVLPSGPFPKLEAHPELPLSLAGARMRCRTSSSTAQGSARRPWCGPTTPRAGMKMWRAAGSSARTRCSPRRSTRTCTATSPPSAPSRGSAHSSPWSVAGRAGCRVSWAPDGVDSVGVPGTGGVRGGGGGRQ